MKKIMIVVVLVIIAFLGWFGYQNYLNSKSLENLINSPKTTEETGVKTSLTPEIEAILFKKIKLVENFAKQVNIITAVEAQNVKNAGLTQSKIKELDDKWIATKQVDEFIESFMTNDTAIALTEFQDSNPGFVEIFVTDKYGLIVGETNKTSDYLQSDEDWWVKAYGNGAGKSYYSEIEYDDSSKSESIALYVPVYNNQNTAVGVIKTVFAITALKNEL